MFQSATLKLTIWYLAILMAISVTFSIIIYQLNYREVSFRLENLQHSIIEELTPTPFSYAPYYDTNPDSPLLSESRKASTQMILSLLYINIALLGAGGLGSFFLARRTLRPIERAHEAQSRFTSDASHELRTPLAAMKAEIEVNLRDPKLELDEARELLESNLEEVNKLIKLSEMLLQLSRLDYDKLERTSVNIGNLFQDVLKRYPQDKQRFVVKSRKKAVTIGNEPAISELMAILVDNALKYSPQGSNITVRIFERRGVVGFEIKNGGEPISEELLPKLFDRFFRGDNSRTNGYKNGYGLGLSIAKKITDIHHGEITVTSTSDATTFKFTLPIIKRISIKSNT